MDRKDRKNQKARNRRKAIVKRQNREKNRSYATKDHKRIIFNMISKIRKDPGAMQSIASMSPEDMIGNLTESLTDACRPGTFSFLCAIMADVRFSELNGLLLMIAGHYIKFCATNRIHLGFMVGSEKIAEDMILGYSNAAVVAELNGESPEDVEMLHRASITLQSLQNERANFSSMSSDRNKKEIEEEILRISSPDHDQKIVASVDPITFSTEFKCSPYMAKEVCEFLCEHGRLERNRHLFSRPVYHVPIPDHYSLTIPIPEEVVEQMMKEEGEQDS